MLMYLFFVVVAQDGESGFQAGTVQSVLTEWMVCPAAGEFAANQHFSADQYTSGNGLQVSHQHTGDDHTVAGIVASRRSLEVRHQPEPGDTR